jgi:hypothetical protein
MIWRELAAEMKKNNKGKEAEGPGEGEKRLFILALLENQ